MDKKNLAFGKSNFIALAIGFVIIVIGFILMAGGSSTAESYNPDIFDAQRIKIAPIVTFIGFVSIIYAIIRTPKDNDEAETAEPTDNTIKA